MAKRSDGEFAPLPGGEAVSPPAGSRHIAGIVSMLAGCLLLTLNDASTKWLTTNYPVSEILFLRGIFSIAIILAVTAWQRQLSTLRANDLRSQIYRAGLFVLTTTLFTISLKLLSLPVVTAISFASPIILTALAGPMLGEKVGPRRWMAVFVGFAGVVLIIQPGTASWNWAALVPLCCAGAAAIRDITTRQLTANESTASILFITAMVTTTAGLSVAPFSGWQMPTSADCALFAFVGASQVSGHFFLVNAFRLTPAVVLAPFKYSMIIWALMLAFLIWGDLPSTGMSAGAGIIVASGLYIFYRERKGQHPSAAAR